MSPEKLWRRIWNTVAHGVVSAMDDRGPVMSVQAKLGYLEINQNIPLVQHFGFSSVPPVGSDIALIHVGGDRSNGFAIASNHQPTRPVNKASGETMVYNAFGMSIYVSRTGITINGGGMPIHVTNTPTMTLDAPQVLTTGNLTVATGATGSFTTPAGLTVTVQDGIVTNIF